MKWLTELETRNISFKICSLKRNDCILNYQEIEKQKIIYLLDGFIQIAQVFTNGEIITQKLLYRNDIFTDIQPTLNLVYQNINYQYKIKALINTQILIIDYRELTKKLKYNNPLLHKILQIYQSNNEEIIKILSHKSAKKRYIQLLLVLTEHFGIYTKHNIIIPFNLSNYNIATIIGSQRITVNKIMNKLKKNKL